MPRKLSSSWTFFEKFIIPIFWVIATFVLLPLVNSGQFPQRHGVPAPELKLYFLGAWAIGSAFVYWYCVRLKLVRVDHVWLYISNYNREIRVPLRDVENVTEQRWVNSHPVTIEFQVDTEFGRRIIFMPKMRWLAGWSSHPVVAELREAASRAKGVTVMSAS